MDVGALLAWTHLTHLQHTPWGESSVSECMRFNCRDRCSCNSTLHGAGFFLMHGPFCEYRYVYLCQSEDFRSADIKRRGRGEVVGGLRSMCVTDEPWTFGILTSRTLLVGPGEMNAKNKMWSSSPDGWSVKKIEQTNTDSDIQESVTLTGLWPPVLTSTHQQGVLISGCWNW